MYKMNKIIFSLLFISMSLLSFAQEIDEVPDMQIENPEHIVDASSEIKKIQHLNLKK